MSDKIQRLRREIRDLEQASEEADRDVVSFGYGLIALAAGIPVIVLLVALLKP